MRCKLVVCSRVKGDVGCYCKRGSLPSKEEIIFSWGQGVVGLWDQ